MRVKKISTDRWISKKGAEGYCVVQPFRRYCENDMHNKLQLGLTKSWSMPCNKLERIFTAMSILFDAEAIADVRIVSPERNTLRIRAPYLLELSHKIASGS